MFRITLIARLAVLAVLASAVAVIAGSGKASLIDVDSVPPIGSSSFSFNYGSVDWMFSDGMYTPNVSGTLTLDNANGSCARVRLEYFHDGKSIAVKYGGSECAPDGKTHFYNVDLAPYSSPDTDLLKVSVEKQTAAGGPSYSIVESAYVSPGTMPDDVLLHSKGVDFGGGSWSPVTGEPTNHASLYWNRSGAGAIAPRLIGYIWLNNVAGLCARVNLRYSTETGSFLAEKHGGAGCAADDDLHAVSVDLQPYTSTEVGKVQVQLQTQGSNGSWNLVGSETVTIDVPSL
jgi:hypothetical protein